MKKSDRAFIIKRILDKNDILDNVAQIKSLMSNGYKGSISFEPFSKKIQNSTNICKEILESIDYIKLQC